ncbi:caspase family protein [Rivihabitans pingtungensis]|uniref:caspase family protein n=1 Tax=Rivihabitans pingtungensis TaxID=1054498 RepID=UPI00289DBF66|nr:caspase family protein [Rivihabitans pingtungensis]
MKRKAILIGNNNGLPGVKVDLANYFNFLQSPTGGYWLPDEISIFLNPTRKMLMSEIDLARHNNYDYIFLVFSGHGAQKRGVLMEINANGEFIYEHELKKISSRQLNIYDCCRNLLHEANESYTMDALSTSARLADKDYIRKKYSDRIMLSIPQQTSLYSCSVGQSSYDTRNGGVYSKFFLESARNIRLSDEYKLVAVSHAEATVATENYCTENKNEEIQKPEAEIPRCISLQQLIISISPYTHLFL